MIWIIQENPLQPTFPPKFSNMQLNKAAVSDREKEKKRKKKK